MRESATHFDSKVILNRVESPAPTNEDLAEIGEF